MRPTRNSRRVPDAKAHARDARAMRRSRSRSAQGTPRGGKKDDSLSPLGATNTTPTSATGDSNNNNNSKRKSRDKSARSTSSNTSAAAKKVKRQKSQSVASASASVDMAHEEADDDDDDEQEEEEHSDEETATEANETATATQSAGESKKKESRKKTKEKERARGKGINKKKTKATSTAAQQHEDEDEDEEDSRQEGGGRSRSRSRSLNGNKKFNKNRGKVQDMQSPVQEITFTRETTDADRMMSGANSHAIQKKKKKKNLAHAMVAPPDLDEPTLQAVKDYLSQNNKIYNDNLQDDELTQFMIRINRVSSQQAAYQHQLVGDSDDSEASLYMEIMAEEEEYAIGHDLFKTMVANIRKDLKKEDQHQHQHQQQSEDFELDSKTLSWIKKAAGLHRSHAESLARQHAIETDASRMMKTRTATRRSKALKRERGIKVLAEALDEFEKEVGGFVEVVENNNNNRNHNHHEKRQREPERGEHNNSSRAKKKPTAPLHTTATTMEEEEEERGGGGAASAAAKTTTKRGEKRKASGKPLVARIRKRRMFRTGTTVETINDVAISRVVVGGKEIHGDSISTTTPMTQSDEPQRGRASKPILNGTSSLRRPPPSLKDIEWKRRQETSLYGDEDNPSLMDPRVRKQVQASRTADLKRAGVVCRLPQWTTVNQGVSDAVRPPRSRHSNQVYASFCLQLVNALSGAARSWAISEFFYSDLDRAWYNRNTFLEDAAKLGISPDARLTASEWKAVRRRISPKPRRFSKRFIATQMSERNAYRNCVRLLHRAPLLGSMFSLPFDVPAPIRIGTKVTAYSRRFRILQRGTILSFDEANARYLILFDAEEFGSEYCPDSEVATHGGPVVLIPATLSFVSTPDYLCNGGTTTIPCGTIKKGPIVDKDRRPSVTLCNELQRALSFTPLKPPQSLAKVAIGNIDSPYAAANTSVTGLRDAVAERDMLTLLLSVADSASKRKAMLLNAMEETCTHQADKLPFGEAEFASSAGPPIQIQGQYAWLRANLDETNQTLRTAMYYLRAMYGKAYLPSKSRGRLCSPPVVNNGLKAILSERMSTPKVALDWAAILATQASDIGESMVSSFPSKAASKEKHVNISQTGRDRLGAVGGLLLAASCCQAVAAAPAATDHEPSLAALQSLSHELKLLVDMPAAVNADDLYSAARRERDLALGDLQDALNLFAAEIAVASTRNELKEG